MGNEIVAAFKAVLGSGKVLSDFGGDDTMDSVNLVLNLVFDITTAITMFLCFFALSASMSANLYEQSKEIGILRATGIRSIRIKLLYFYEALVLVLSACLQGMLIGFIVGYTMVLQSTLFTHIPVVFYFPWDQFGLILGMSVICAFLSTFGPATQLTNKQISAIFRII